MRADGRNKYRKVTEETEFYAISQEVFRDQEEPFATGILFEIVEARDIDVFLGISEDMGKLYERRESKACGMAIEAFKAGGISGEEFGRVKFAYLAETSFYQFQWYLDETEIPLIPLGQWFRFTLNTGSSEERPGYIVALEGMRDYPNIKTHYQKVEARLLEVGPKMQEKLTELYHLPAMEGGGLGEDTLLGPTDIIHDIRVLNMGQALCMEIRNHAGNPLVFFDFGVPATAGHEHHGHAPEYPTLEQHMQDIQASDADVYVVLSHWHWDHASAAVPLTGYMGCTKWKVPDAGMPPSSGLLIQSIRHTPSLNNIESYSGTLNITALGGNPGFKFGKINTDGTHVHLKGMYAQVRTESQKAYLLSGDTVYAGIPIEVRAGMGNANGYSGLQASHHGGEYFASPVAHNQADIPSPIGLTPSPPPGTPVVVYSCGAGNAFGHPNTTYTEEYTARGWSHSHRTDTDGGIVMT